MASCWKGFIKKDKCKFASVDKVIVMLQCKCKSWRSFIPKISGDATSWQTWILAWLQCKWSVDPALWLKKSATVASLQRWVLMRLLGKSECLCNFMEKTTDVVMLQRQVLKQLNCQDKSQYSFKDKCQWQHQCIMNTSVKFDIKTQRSKKLCCKTKTSNKKKKKMSGKRSHST